MVLVAVLAGALLLYGLVARRLATTPMTGAMLFMLLGLAMGPEAFGLVEGPEETRVLEWLLEGTLVLVLFADAYTINAWDWRRDGGIPLRLLSIGMSLTIMLGFLLALVLVDALSVWEAVVLAVVLAPTDAALGKAVVSSERVPPLIRNSLNVESGLNDGLAVPLLAVALVGAAATEGETGVIEALVRAVVLSGAIGAAVAWIGGRAFVVARSRGWMGGTWAQLTLAAMPFLVFALADLVEGSGFIAAWVAGLVAGKVVARRIPGAEHLSEEVGELLSSISLFAFGAVMLGPVLADLDAVAVVYAILSLTVVRMLPVAVSLFGSGLRGPSVVFIGWFGPRGLASAVFALLVIEAELAGGRVIATTVIVTIAMSVLVHGATAVIGANRYGRWYERAVAEHPELVEAATISGPPARRRLLVDPHG